jgi:hypothetical protein
MKDEQVVSPMQALPQLPQLALSLCRFAQTPPHCVVGHAHEHEDALQLRGAVHAEPQRPQWSTFVLVSTQPTPSQYVCGHGHEHTPLVHPAVPLHARPHVPQFDGSALRFTHPLAAPQNVSPKAAQRQVLEVGSQYWSAAQTSPQPAQFIASMATHRPPHSRVPNGHAHAVPSQT